MRHPKSNNREGKAYQGGGKIEGRYANYFNVGHNALEFVLDFGQHYSENEEAELYTRIITSPCYAKELLETLRESIAQYEKAFGIIKEEKLLSSE
jgi:hypothetical protein